MGSSRDIAIGPVAVVSLLLGTLLRNEIDPKTHPLEYKRLAFTATFFAGITQAALGFFRSVPSGGSQFVGSSGLLAWTVYVVCNWTLSQARVYHRVLVSCCHHRVHGRCSHHHCSSATERIPWNCKFHKENWYCISHEISLGKCSPWGKILYRVDLFLLCVENPNIWDLTQFIIALLVQWNWQTILIGASFLAFLLIAKYIVRQYQMLQDHILAFLWLFGGNHTVSFHNSG